MRRKKHADMNALPPEEIPAEEPEKTYFPRQESRPLEKCAPPEPPAERPAREALTRGQKLIVLFGSVITVLLAVLIVLVVRNAPGKHAGERVVVMGDGFEELYVETAGNVAGRDLGTVNAHTTVRRVIATTYPASARVTKAKTEKTTKAKAEKTTKAQTERVTTARVIPTTIPATTEPGVAKEEIEAQEDLERGVGYDYIGQEPDEGVGYEDVDRYADAVNINTASAAELKTLDGIGDAKAQAIITYREQNGPFASIEEIMDVPGIGEGVFGAIWYRITV